MSHYLMTAAGPDRPGLVAAAAKLLYGLGCNLEDSAMTRLQGEFAMLVIFSAPPAADQAALSAGLKALEKSGVRVDLKPLAPQERQAPRAGGRPRLVTVYGPDKPGIVFRVTDALAGKGFNVTDLSTHRTEGATAGYILYLEGDAPVDVADEDLAKAVRAGAGGLDLTVGVKPLDSSAL